MGSLQDYLVAHRDLVYPLLREFLVSGEHLLSRPELLRVFARYCQDEAGSTLHDSDLGSTIRNAQEAVVEGDWIYFAVRYSKGGWHYIRFHAEDMLHEEVSVADYLAFKEQAVVPAAAQTGWRLEVDLQPFKKGIPGFADEQSLGQGMLYLSRVLFSELFRGPEGRNKLLEFLCGHQYQGVQLMLNPRIHRFPDLDTALKFSTDYLATQPSDLGWKQVAFQLQAFGLEPGWGATVATMLETLSLFRSLLEQPDPQRFEKFMNRIPVVFTLVVVALKGYFSQSGVLGMPETGTQLVYTLDQVRALAQCMRQRLQAQGVELEPQVIVLGRLIPDAQKNTCSQPEERLIGSRGARILRLPFYNSDGVQLRQWLPEQEMWPYLERFAMDACREIRACLQQAPDLVVGNNASAGLVASLMCQELGVTQCQVGLELPDPANLFPPQDDTPPRRGPQRQEAAACELTAQLVAMNTADLIVTSTRQEIAGDHDQPGHYERYQSFAVPGLYRVVHGIDIREPRFNTIAPGVNPDLYFAYDQRQRRLASLEGEITSLIFGAEDKHCRGTFVDCNKQLVFVLSGLRAEKNISGLLEWYAGNLSLRETANLLIVSGHIDPAEAGEREQQQEIRNLHKLMDQYALDGSVRWVGKQLEKNLAGELYRYIADMRGIFINPAREQNFSLTILEAMASGLPTFASKYGGSMEMIVDGVSGFHIDPDDGAQVTDLLFRFFKQCQANRNYWDSISAAAVTRVASHFNWAAHSEKLLEIAGLHRFWRQAASVEQAEKRRYLQMFYGLQYRPLASALEKMLRHH